jgi:sugar phosphate isomerase/epimerase
MEIRGGFIYTVTKYGSVPSLEQMASGLRDLRSFGYQYAELEGRDPDHLQMVADNRDQLSDVCQELGMCITNFVMMLPETSSLDAADRDRAIEVFSKATEMAKFFGCRTMEVVTYPAPLVYDGDPTEPDGLRTTVDPHYEWDTQWQALGSIVRKFSRLAAATGCQLQIHPRIGELVSNTEGMLRLLDSVREDNLGLVFDAAQLHAQKEILPISVEKIHDRIWTLHVSDNDGRMHRHSRLGRGTIDWEGLFATLKKHNFRWNVAVDVVGEGDIDEDYRESKRFLDELAARVGIH